MPAVAPGRAPADGDRVSVGAAMVRLSVPLVPVNGPVPTELSVTLAVKVKVPLAVGVPVMVQSAFSEAPAGNAPVTGVGLQL